MDLVGSRSRRNPEPIQEVDGWLTGRSDPKRLTPGHPIRFFATIAAEPRSSLPAPQAAHALTFRVLRA